jgi:hypothetical protein
MRVSPNKVRFARGLHVSGPRFISPYGDLAGGGQLLSDLKVAREGPSHGVRDSRSQAPCQSPSVTCISETVCTFPIADKGFMAEHFGGL